MMSGWMCLLGVKREGGKGYFLVVFWFGYELGDIWHVIVGGDEIQGQYTSAYRPLH